MNFPASYHDVWCLQNSKLLQDPNYVELFDRNTFIADGGFPGFQNVLYPVTSVEMKKNGKDYLKKKKNIIKLFQELNEYLEILFSKNTVFAELLTVMT